jgi:hypothetical protein
MLNNIPVRSLQEYRNRFHGISEMSGSKNNRFFNNVRKKFIILFFKIYLDALTFSY